MNIAEILKYGTDRHERVRKAIIARYEMSRMAMSERHEDWRRAEEDFRGYTPESTEDSRRKSERSSGIINYTTITVPLTYAMALTGHTYWASIFLNRTPILQLDTRKGLTEAGVQPMEALIDYQIHVGQILVPYYIWLLDPAKYGLGILATYWDRQVKRVAHLEDGPVIDAETGIAIPGRTETRKVTQELPGYSGNKAYNVRPYNWFPDTRRALVDFQKGEFCGDITYENVQSITVDESYINRGPLKDHMASGRRGREEDVGSEQIQLPGIEDNLTNLSDINDNGSVSILRMVVKVIPKDWGLGDETRPEKWVFEVADKQVIISAEPFGYIHDEFPYDTLFYEVDGYALNIRGMMEIGRDMNTAASWELNSHMFNVRKALNDQLIVDPSRILMKDLTDGGPGKVLRVKPTAYGQDVRTMVSQLQVTDVTQQNIRDMQTISEVMQRILGVNDTVMGTLDPGGRKTATEVRSASTFSISRLKTIAEYFSATGFSSHTRKLIQNTQQFYFADPARPSQEVFRVVGELVEGMDTVDVTAASISGSYDFIPVDGTLPIDRMAQAELWKEILLGLVKTGLAETYNIDEMFNMVAGLTGIRSLKRFKIRAMPDAQVQQQAQAGNLIPISGAQRGR